MKLKSNRSFSLTEVLITVSILSTLIVFIFRALNTCLSAARLSQNISTACFLAESKLWEAELKLRQTDGNFVQSGKEDIRGKEFTWLYEITKLEDTQLLKLNLRTSWNEKTRKEKYSLDFFTYLFKESALP